MAYTIAEAAKKIGVTSHTLRFYEKEGLLPFIKRTPSGLRTFSDTDIDALKIIMCLKNTGMQIKDIKSFIDLCSEGDSSLEKRLDFMRRQKESVEAQIAQMKKHYDTILYKEQYYIDAIKERDLIRQKSS